MNFRAEKNELHQGFQMTFANGCTISVQFSKGNYCDQGETTAEVAVWDKDYNWYVLNEEDNHMSLIKLQEGSDVIGYCTTDLVAFIIELTKKLK
jgi:hypothetical protein